MIPQYICVKPGVWELIKQINFPLSILYSGLKIDYTKYDKPSVFLNFNYREYNNINKVSTKEIANSFRENVMPLFEAKNFFKTNKTIWLGKKSLDKRRTFPNWLAWKK